MTNIRAVGTLGEISRVVPRWGDFQHYCYLLWSYRCRGKDARPKGQTHKSYFGDDEKRVESVS